MHLLLPSADIAKVSSALILFDFIHAKVISDSGNGGDGCRGSPSWKTILKPVYMCVCMAILDVFVTAVGSLLSDDVCLKRVVSEILLVLCLAVTPQLIVVQLNLVTN